MFLFLYLKVVTHLCPQFSPTLQPNPLMLNVLFPMIISRTIWWQKYIIRFGSGPFPTRDRDIPRPHFRPYLNPNSTSRLMDLMRVKSTVKIHDF